MRQCLPGEALSVEDHHITIDTPLALGFVEAVTVGPAVGGGDAPVTNYWLRAEYAAEANAIFYAVYIEKFPIRSFVNTIPSPCDGTRIRCFG